MSSYFLPPTFFFNLCASLFIVLTVTFFVSLSPSQPTWSFIAWPITVLSFCLLASLLTCTKGLGQICGVICTGESKWHYAGPLTYLPAHLRTSSLPPLQTLPLALPFISPSAAPQPSYLHCRFLHHILSSLLYSSLKLTPPSSLSHTSLPHILLLSPSPSSFLVACLTFFPFI